MHRLTVTLSTAFIILASANASAQSALASRPSVSLSAGAFFFDLSGTGVAPMAVVRGDLPLNRFIAFDGGLIGALPTQDFLERTTLLAPEIGMQLQVPRRFAPYLSADIGRIFAIRGSSLGGTRNDVSYSAALGTRVWLREHTGVRAEFRLRGVGEGFTGSAAEVTLGVAWR